MTGWELLEARGVSASGNTIVGTGINPTSFQEAWIARFGPEGIAGLTTPGSLQNSVNALADDRPGSWRSSTASPIRCSAATSR
jgi:hypothetical protein